jgi:hypothetical protein
MSMEMAYAHLGRSGLLVSRIGVGTLNFGYTVDEPSSFAVMDAAIDAGINFFDTADVYGGPQSADMKKGYGIAEETLGRWLQRSGHRDDIVLATKVYQPMGLGPNDRRLSAYHIRRACEASLRRLQTDHIDLFFDPAAERVGLAGVVFGSDCASKWRGYSRCDFLGLEPSRRHQLEGPIQDGTDGFFALEATTARVLEHDVKGHHLHHSLDVLLVEHVVEARNRGQYVSCEVHDVRPLIPRGCVGSRHCDPDRD